MLLHRNDISIWKNKLDWIAGKGGMALINTHPDYMNFSNEPCGNEEYPAAWYAEFLEYVRDTYHGNFWHALPRDIARFWAQPGAHQAVPPPSVKADGAETSRVEKQRTMASHLYEI